MTSIYTSKKKSLPEKDRKESILVILCVLGLILSALLLTSNRAFYFIFGRTSKVSDVNSIGTISFAKKDVRHKDVLSFEWKPADVNEPIHLGDGVFTGDDSHSRVSLNTASHIDLGPNTLIIFSKIDNFSLPNLKTGNFRLSFSGSVKIAIRDKISEFTGDQSEVQVLLKPNSDPQIRLLKGRARLKKGATDSDVALSENYFISFSSMSTKDIVPSEKLGPFEHIETFYELYSVVNGKIRSRDVPLNCFAQSVEFPWPAKNVPPKIYAQIAQSDDFKDPIESFEMTANSHHSTRACGGKNLWHLSTDQVHWSQPFEVQVDATLLKIPSPIILLDAKSQVILDKNIEIKVALQSDPNIHHIVLEKSRSPSFPSDDTEIIWTDTKHPHWTESRPGHFFIRVRGVDKNQNLTEYSSLADFTVLKPERPEAPRLATTDYAAIEGEELQLAWSPSRGAELYEIEIHKQGTQFTQAQRVRTHQASWTANKIGEYRISLTAIDRWGRKIKSRRRGSIIVAAKKVPDEPVVANRVEASRLPSSTSTIHPDIQESAQPPLNAYYRSSKLSVEGGDSVMYSQDQLDQQKQRATLATLGLRSETWFGANGIEGNFFKSLVILNPQSHNPSNPLQFEARYHRRWLIPFNPLSSLNTAQISLIGGFEYYQNAEAALYSPHYQIVKAGFALKFPIASHWDSGGEVLVGTGLDGSSKYEFSGYADYYLQETWSLGLGYRINLFQAGSASSTPLGMPYKEGYGVGYSTLRWHY